MTFSQISAVLLLKEENAPEQCLFVNRPVRTEGVVVSSLALHDQSSSPTRLILNPNLG